MLFRYYGWRYICTYSGLYRKERQLTASESGHYWRGGEGEGGGGKQAVAQIEAGGSVHVTHLHRSDPPPPCIESSGCEWGPGSQLWAGGGGRKIYCILYSQTTSLGVSSDHKVFLIWRLKRWGGQQMKSFVCTPIKCNKYFE